MYKIVSFLTAPTQDVEAFEEYYARADGRAGAGSAEV